MVSKHHRPGNRGGAAHPGCGPPERRQDSSGGRMEESRNDLPPRGEMQADAITGTSVSHSAEQLQDNHIEVRKERGKNEATDRAEAQRNEPGEDRERGGEPSQNCVCMAGYCGTPEPNVTWAGPARAGRTRVARTRNPLRGPQGAERGSARRRRGDCRRSRAAAARRSGSARPPCDPPARRARGPRRPRRPAAKL